MAGSTSFQIAGDHEPQILGGVGPLVMLNQVFALDVADLS